ncbi:MAG TPA: hypothetical protein VI248_07800 [Kineosporiaceae bacterium]
MSVDPTALWWARARAGGPLRVPAGTVAPDVLLRLGEPDASGVWLVAVPPEQGGSGALTELGLAGPLVEQPNDTARLLAAVLRCCWRDPTGPVWPGVPAPWSAVTSVFRHYADRDEGAFRRAAVAAVRRLHGAGWVSWDERARLVRVGPRVASWSAADLTVLREMYRQMPAAVGEAAVGEASVSGAAGNGVPDPAEVGA